MRRTILHRVLIVAFGAAVVAAAGCQLDGSLLSKHMSGDGRADAKQQWQAVRGRVRLQLARQHLEAGRLSEAEVELEQAIAISPEEPQAYLVAARLRLEQDKPVEAREVIAIALSMAGDDPEIAYFAGVVAQRYGELERALVHYTVAFERAPTAAAYLLAQAEMLVALDRPAEAMSVVGACLNDFSGSVAVQMLAARVSQILGLRGPAAAYCLEALRLDKDDRVVQAEAGLILAWARRYADAIAALRPLLECEQLSDDAATGAGSSGDAYVSPAVVHALARAYLATGEGREARRVLERAMAQGSEHAITHCLHAQAALMSGDLDLAARAATKAQAAARTAETSLLAAYVALRREDYDGAVSAAEAALALDERLVAAHCLIIKASSSMGRVERAREAYAAAVALEPDSPLLQVLRTAMPAAESRDVSRVLSNATLRLDPVRPEGSAHRDAVPVRTHAAARIEPVRSVSGPWQKGKQQLENAVPSRENHRRDAGATVLPRSVSLKGTESP
jgi:Tfp pilus assembly protein PilF